MSTDLYELLLKIKLKPGLYLGKPTLSGLSYLITGYALKEYELGECKNTLIEFSDFNRYVASFYGLSEHISMSKDSFTLIEENSEDDSKAFFKFFEILDEYMCMVKIAGEMH